VLCCRGLSTGLLHMTEVYRDGHAGAMRRATGNLVVDSVVNRRGILQKQGGKDFNKTIYTHERKTFGTAFR
jgi:hypothetical protein